MKSVGSWPEKGVVHKHRHHLAKSQKTPVDKSANINHDSENIVGHVVDSYLVDREHNKIEGELPDYCHLMVENVIYRTIGEKAEQLIEDIEADRMFVSMECLFTDFDYLLSSAASQYVVQRNDGSRWLSKHLLAFGGSGTYQGYGIGRVLRNVVFVANGFVKTPANPGSVVVASGWDDGRVREWWRNKMASACK